MTFDTIIMVFIFVTAITDTRFATKALGTYSVIIIPALTAIGASHTFRQMAFKASVAAPGAFSATDIAFTAVVAKVRCCVATFRTMVFFIAASSAICAAMVAAIADIIISAAFAAIFAFNIVVPSVNRCYGGYAQNHNECKQ